MGIRCCWLIFSEYADVGEDDEQDDGPFADGNEASDETTGEEGSADEGLEEQFVEMVREIATQDHDRLL